MPSGVAQYAGKCGDQWADADSSLAANSDKNVPTQKAVKAHANANPLSVYAAGTAYQLTASDAALDFGTTDPSLTLTKAGTYLLTARVRLDYNGATFSAVRTATLKLRRTNNTAADLSNGSAAAKTQRLMCSYRAGCAMMAA
jgi:hypothetical protein